MVYIEQRKISVLNERTQKTGTARGSFQIALLATNGKNTVVICPLGCGASAVRRSPPRSGGSAPAVG